jgi:hypothetical protein
MKYVLMFLFVLSLAFSATVYVDSATGSDQLGDGTAEHPYKTIAEGISNADFTDGVAYVAIKYVSDANRGYTFSQKTITLLIDDTDPSLGTFEGTALTEADEGKLLYSEEDDYALKIIDVVPGSPDGGDVVFEEAFDTAGLPITGIVYNQPSRALTIANANTSIALGKRLCLVGYHTAFNAATGVSDMDVGQPYYQHPRTCLDDGITAGKTVPLVADSTLGSDFVLVQTNFLQLRNLHLYNTGTSGDLLNMSNANTQYVEFYNCRFGATGKAVVADWYATTPRRGVVFYGCYINTNNESVFAVNVAGGGCVVFDRCVFRGYDNPVAGNNTWSLYVGQNSQVAVCNSYFYNGDAGLFPDAGAHAFVTNCRFDSQKKFCVGALNSVLHVMNSILVARNGGTIIAAGPGGGTAVLDYNIYWYLGTPDFWYEGYAATTIAPPQGAFSKTYNPGVADGVLIDMDGDGEREWVGIPQSPRGINRLNGNRLN